MPELPEVETVARGLHRRVAGDRIESLWLGAKKEPLKSPAGEMTRLLEGAGIRSVRRVGKHIVFDLVRGRGDGGHWIVHLGMTGRMVVAAPADPVAPHTHAVARLGSGRELRFVDPRRFGRLSVSRKDFCGPGTEPLTVSEDAFAALFRGRRTPIKAALLDQRLLHGVGNIYADEALFRAGIRPRRRAGCLSRAESRRLRNALRTVLREAIRLGGSSVSDYVDADGEAGFFQLRHRVYQRAGRPCYTCKTAIKRIVVAGRGTHYCPLCQK
jgi:formamidopyrimidine-DNA glycosylase